eukprot:scaffold58854_cov26-Tisochrysis_lutea.AAC.5
MTTGVSAEHRDNGQRRTLVQVDVAIVKGVGPALEQVPAPFTRSSASLCARSFGAPADEAAILWLRVRRHPPLSKSAPQ